MFKRFLGIGYYSSLLTKDVTRVFMLQLNNMMRFQNDIIAFIIL
jgi:hypothetical protein